MNPLQGDAPAPRIDINVRPDGVAIRQYRPSVASSLVGKPVVAALPLVPLLLPICGQAQSVAAGRAIAAARGQAVSAEQEGANARLLWREQALAAAWRCTVDWPDLLGESRELATLKHVRGATTDQALGAQLQLLLPGLEPVTGIDNLVDWVGAGGCIPARLARLAMGARHKASDPAPVGDASPETLLQAAARAFAQEPFDALDPAGSPREVGPMMMARDELVDEVRSEVSCPVLARLLALVLDMRVIYRALLCDPPRENESHSAPGESGTGIGSAMTARGPVFHRVSLDPSDTVIDWRVLAPTDWHFGPRGPVVREVGVLHTPAALRLLVASYDPCAPWFLHTDSDEGEL